MGISQVLQLQVLAVEAVGQTGPVNPFVHETPFEDRIQISLVDLGKRLGVMGVGKLLLQRRPIVQLVVFFFFRPSVLEGDFFRRGHEDMMSIAPFSFHLQKCTESEDMVILSRHS